ncbi:putative Ig domain-containing protein [Pimelobacter simplex]|uniref:putative Ig domain-containing protein n=1 Tax=Nocardioides simplex TaxID=2045 RepID=UPI00366F7A4E
MLLTRLLRTVLPLLLAALLLTGVPGVADAATKRTVSLTAAPAQALTGSTVTLAGRLTRSPKGTPLVVERKVGARWTKVKAAKTKNKAGAYAVTLARPTTAGTYYYRAVAPKRGKLKAATSRPVAVVAQTSVAVGLTVDPASVVDGVPTTVTLRGTVRPFATGTTVTLQSRSGAVWVPVTTATLDATGSFAATTTASGATTYRATVPAGGPRLAGVSPLRTLGATTPVPVIATSSLPDGLQGTEYSKQLTAVGNPAGTWSVMGLPNGLTYAAATGLISGTPTTPGTSSVTIGFTQTANGVAANPVVLPLHVAAAPPPVIATSSLPDGLQGTAYSKQLTAVGNPAGTWSVSGLPAGLTYAAATGLITGIPTAAGTSSVTLNFTQTSTGVGASPVILPLLVTAPPPPVIATGTLPDGVQGTAYSKQLTAVGNPAGTWSVSGLPAGMTYAAATGLITGTPNAAGTSSVTLNFTQTSTGVAASPVVLLLRIDATVPLPTTVRLSAGGQHGCRVKADHTVDCWGYNFAQQIGQQLNLQVPRNPTPTQVGSASDWVEISAGGAAQWAHTCGIRADRSLWCWGSNVDGELGQPGAGTEFVPKRVDAGRNWASVSSGYAHTCAITTDRQLWCWGNDTFGQLGRTGDAAPAQVGTRSDWTTVSAGYTHTCATTTGGELWCWGFNSRGQLGDGTTGGSDVPVREDSDGTTWTGVSVSAGTSCALKSDATLWCWGYNAHGETGTGTPGTDRLVPTQVGSANDWESVSATGGSGQGNHACGVRTSGQLWCWGLNNDGELGTGDTVARATPVRVGTDSDWAQVATGGTMTYALKDDGTQRAWGNNFQGQLGTGGVNAGSLVPVTILP